MGAEETKEKLIMLRSITAEQQERGAEALGYKGAAADGTIEGVIDEIGNAPGIENAVVIKNTDVPKFLKSYTELEITEEYKIVYAGASNQIVAQGMILFPWQGTAPNGVTIKSLRTTDIGKMPDIPFYIDVNFSPYSVTYDFNSSDQPLCELRGFSCRLRDQAGVDTDTGATRQNYYIEYKSYLISSGEKIELDWPIPTTEDGYVGFSFAWTKLIAPGEECKIVGDKFYAFEFGCAAARLIYKWKSQGYYGFESGVPHYIPFANIAEYNAAVALTAVPQTMATAKTVEL